MSEEPLTPAQIENWRNILLGMIGPYAMLMPDSEIEAYRNKLQASATLTPETEQN